MRFSQGAYPFFLVLRRFVSKHAGKLKKQKDEMKTLFIPRSFG